MHDFFKVLSVAECVAALRSFSRLAEESTPLSEADGRVLARDIRAAEDLPLMDRSSMDGYAVNARDTFGGSEGSPAYLECVGSIDIQTPPDFVLKPGECAEIVTGGCLPEGADAVMMVEYTEAMAGTVEMRRSVAPGDNVMLRGEDARRDEVALAAGTVLRPQEIGLLAALGYPEVPVRRRPVVGIISTGDELVPVEAEVRPGLVRDVNSATLAAIVRRAGGEPVGYGLVPDTREALDSALAKAVNECDVTLLSGGSSIGVRDFTLAAVAGLPDSEVICHGVAISPGKPLILGRVGAKAVVGLPGQVTSAQVVMQVLGHPFLRHLQGETEPFENFGGRPAVRAVLSRNIASKPGREDHVRVRLTPVPDGLPQAEPLLGRSGLLGTLLRAQGLVRIAETGEGLTEGTEVDVLLLP